jgi:hypothetical protein
MFGISRTAELGAFERLYDSSCSTIYQQQSGTTRTTKSRDAQFQEFETQNNSFLNSQQEEFLEFQGIVVVGQVKSYRQFLN